VRLTVSPARTIRPCCDEQKESGLLALFRLTANAGVAGQASPVEVAIVTALLSTPPARTWSDTKQLSAVLDGKVKTIWSRPGKPCDRPAYIGVTSTPFTRTRAWEAAV